MTSALVCYLAFLAACLLVYALYGDHDGPNDDSGHDVL